MYGRDGKMAIPTKFLTEYSHPGEKLPWWENARLAEKDGLRWSFILDISSVTLTVLPSDCKTLFIAVTVITIISTIITSILFPSLSYFIFPRPSHLGHWVEVEGTEGGS